MNVNQLLFIILSFAFVPCAQSIEPQEETGGRHGCALHEEDIPCEIMVEIFKKLPIADIVRSSLVCKRWHRLGEESQLWKEVRGTIHGDYPEKESTKENAKIHWLRVMVNTHSDLEKIEYLVNKYQLNKYHPFIPYRVLLIMFLFTKEIIDERVAQGDEIALKRKTDGLAYGWYGYEKNSDAAFTCNRRLFQKGKEETSESKNTDLYFDGYSGEQALSPLKNWIENEELKGSRWAYYIKAQGLKYGICGFDKDRPRAIKYIKKHGIPY